ncbi:MAG TPA: M23 family metallopeptidase [Thermoanaerobaculia bacterium]|nr:M23 family metallopeptidase [Thermoanaerobaculia bacterium]
MRTFRVLLCGWLLGGAVLVIWSAVAAPTAPVEPPASVGPAGALKPAAFGDLLIPVVGVEASDLHDDYAQPRSGGRTHAAIDILAPRGTPVVAAVDGTVRKLFSSKAGGITIYEFDRDERRVYYYAHLDSYANGLAEGLAVRQGTVLGYVGTTGNAPPGTPHLHFAIEDLPPTKEWWKGSPVNPYPLLTTTRVSALR